MGVSEEQLAAVAAELGDGKWWKRATRRELCELLGMEWVGSSGPGSIGDDKTIETLDRGGLVSEERAQRVRRRIRLRALLALPTDDCTARWPNRNPACYCLTAALDSLDDEESADKAEVLKAARKLHVRRPRKAKPKPQPAVSEPAHGDVEPIAPLVSEPLPTPEADKTQTPVLPRGVQEPAHPLSWAAFKRGSDGPSLQDIIERIF